MTKHEQSQENYKGYEDFANKAFSVLKGKTYTITVRDRKEYEDYDVEFSLENVYSFFGEMIAFDIKVSTMKGQYGVNARKAKYIKENNPNLFRRVTNAVKEDFSVRFKKDLTAKAALWSIGELHINNVTV